MTDAQSNSAALAVPPLDRSTFVGASDVASILGVGYRSAIDTWLEKTRQLPPRDHEPEFFYWGKKHEALIAAEYALRNNRSLAYAGDANRAHRELPVLHASPDFLIEAIAPGESVGALDCKTVGEYRKHEWHDGPPIAYLIQVQSQLEVFDLDFGALAALIGGNHYRNYHLERDRELGALILDEVRGFWQLVENRTPPPPTASRRCREALKRLYPRDDGEAVELPAEAATWARQRAALKVAAKSLDAQLVELDNQIVAAIGSASYGVIPGGGHFSHRVQTRKGYSVEPTEFRVLRHLDRDLNQ